MFAWVVGEGSGKGGGEIAGGEAVGEGGRGERGDWGVGGEMAGWMGMGTRERCVNGGRRKVGRNVRKWNVG